MFRSVPRVHGTDYVTSLYDQLRPYFPSGFLEPLEVRTANTESLLYNQIRNEFSRVADLYIERKEKPSFCPMCCNNNREHCEHSFRATRCDNHRERCKHVLVVTDLGYSSLLGRLHEFRKNVLANGIEARSKLFGTVEIEETNVRSVGSILGRVSFVPYNGTGEPILQLYVFYRGATFDIIQELAPSLHVCFPLLALVQSSEQEQEADRSPTTTTTTTTPLIGSSLPADMNNRLDSISDKNTRALIQLIHGEFPLDGKAMDATKKIREIALRAACDMEQVYASLGKDEKNSTYLHQCLYRLGEASRIAQDGVVLPCAERHAAQKSWIGSEQVNDGDDAVESPYTPARVTRPSRGKRVGAQP